MHPNPKRSKHPGVDVRHSRSCGTRGGLACSCRPTFQAHVWSARDHKRIRKTFPTLKEARRWRSEAQVGIARGTLRPPTRVTVAEASAAWIEGAASGLLRTRKGTLYKPSALRSYEQALRLRVVPALGHRRLSDVTTLELQEFVAELQSLGLESSTIRNALMPLRA